MMHKLAVLVALFALSGCAFGEGSNYGSFWFDDSWFDDPAGDQQPHSSEASITDAHLLGDIGYASGVDHEAEILDYYSDGWFTQFVVLAEVEGGVAMMVPFIEGGSLEDLAALNGPTTFRAHHDDQPMIVSVWGCSGLDPEQLDYDETADETVVRPEAVPGDEEQVSVTLTSQFLDPWGERTEASTRLVLRF
jgi:hypothetical protein